MQLKSIKILLILLILTFQGYLGFTQKGSGCPDDIMPKLSATKNWGYADLFGNWVIEPIYSKVSLFVEGKAVVQRGILCGVIDCEGNVILQCNYQKLTNFRNGKVWAMQNDFWGLIGPKGQIFQPHLYDEIMPIANSELAWVKKDNMWGLFNEDKNTFICKPQFDMAQIMSPNASLVKRENKLGVLNHVNCGFLLPLELTKVKKVGQHDILYEQNNKWGVFNELGKIILNPEYDTIFIVEDELLQVKQNENYGLYSLKGKKILPIAYEEIGELKEGYISIKQNGKYGYCSRLGKVYIKPTYDAAFPFQNKKAVVKKGNVWGVVDVSNKIVLPFQFEEILSLDNGKFYAIKSQGAYQFFSNDFKKLREEKVDQVFATDTILALRVKKNNQFYYFNLLANDYFTVDNFELAEPFKNGFAIVGRADKKGVLDRNGKLILAIQYDNLLVDRFQSKVIIRVLTNGKQGILDAEGKILIPQEYEAILPALPNYLKVSKNGKFGIMRTDGLSVVEPIYDFMGNIENAPNAPEWPALVALKGKFGLINEKGEEVFPIKSKDLRYVGASLFASIESKEIILINVKGAQTPVKYDAIGYFGDGLVAVKKGDKWGYINGAGEERIKLQFEQAELYTNKMAAVKFKGKWGVIDRMGKWLIQPENDDYKVDGQGNRILIREGKSYLLQLNGTLK